MFDQFYGVGMIEGDIICEEKSLKNACGAPVSSSFILEQQLVFRDKNEAGMQCDIIEEGEERLRLSIILRILKDIFAPLQIIVPAPRNQDSS